MDCPTCGVVSENLTWAAHDSALTLDFEEMTAYLAQRRTVGTIVKRIVAERLDPRRLADLYVIGVDEISSAGTTSA